MSAENPVIIQSDDEETECLDEVTDCFPDICPDFLRRIAKTHDYDACQIISAILDAEASGEPYGRRAKRKELKRKRDGSSSDTEATERKMRAKYNNIEGRAVSAAQNQATLLYLASEFPSNSLKSIKDQMEVNKNQLFPTYMVLFDKIYKNRHELLRWEPFDLNNPPHVRGITGHDDALNKEFRSARSICTAKKTKFLANETHEKAEMANFERAKKQGEVADCGCCFDQFALNRLVHCDGETAHFYCCGCMRRHTEHQIGLARFELRCISIEGCAAGFSSAERGKFLNGDLVATLDRIETESVLRAAGIEDLVMCPFCPYAAICPPVEVDKEFRCLNPECEIISCRLCMAETHLPKSCEDANKVAASARRKIEEAMSAALIRKCNKCGIGFIKSFGCNKMTCPRSGCRNVQCYVCSESCGYEHFNDPNRGGKKGQCPLYDANYDRHEEEVKQAAIKTKEEILKEQPSIRPELLEIKTPKVAPPRTQRENLAHRGLEDLLFRGDDPNDVQRRLWLMGQHYRRNDDDQNGRRAFPPMARLFPLGWNPRPEGLNAFAELRAQQLADPRPALPMNAFVAALVRGGGRGQGPNLQNQVHAVERVGMQRANANHEDMTPHELERLADFRIQHPGPPLRRIWGPVNRAMDLVFGNPPWGRAAPDPNAELPGGHRNEAEGVD